MTMCVNRVSGTSLSGWFFCEMWRALGSEDLQNQNYILIEIYSTYYEFSPQTANKFKS